MEVGIKNWTFLTNILLYSDVTKRTNEPFISGSTAHIKRDKHNSKNSHLNYDLRTKN